MVPSPATILLPLLTKVHNVHSLSPLQMVSKTRSSTRPSCTSCTKECTRAPQLRELIHMQNARSSRDPECDNPSKGLLWDTSGISREGADVVVVLDSHSGVVTAREEEVDEHTSFSSTLDNGEERAGERDDFAA